MGRKDSRAQVDDPVPAIKEVRVGVKVLLVDRDPGLAGGEREHGVDGTGAFALL